MKATAHFRRVRRMQNDNSPKTIHHSACKLAGEKTPLTSVRRKHALPRIIFKVNARFRRVRRTQNDYLPPKTIHHSACKLAGEKLH